METLDKVQRRIETTEDLESVVRTMKALAAVNIRQYERAVESLADYRRTIDLGMQILLRSSPELVERATRAPRLREGAVVFGSDQGMCGPLNDGACRHALEQLGELEVPREDRVLLSVGSRMTGRLEEAGQRLTGEIRLPGSIPGIAERVGEILVAVDDWQMRLGVDRLLLVYARHESRAAYRPEVTTLLPLDEQWIGELRARPWDSPGLPLITMEPGPLFSALLRQHLFVGIYRAFAESLASENASRLASMRRAESNISERLDELRKDYHQQRQAAVTSELLDIIGAFETLDEENE